MQKLSKGNYIPPSTKKGEKKKHIFQKQKKLSEMTLEELNKEAIKIEMKLFGHQVNARKNLI